MVNWEGQTNEEALMSVNRAQAWGGFGWEHIRVAFPPRADSSKEGPYRLRPGAGGDSGLEQPLQLTCCPV